MDTVVYDIVGYTGKDGKQEEDDDDFGMTAQAGDGVDVTVTVWDDVGNKSRPVKVTGVTFDNVPLELARFFPFSGDVRDTVTIETVDVVMQVNEAADSVSVRWVEFGKDGEVISKPKVKSVTDLAKDTDIDIRFASAFGDDDDDVTFTLQTFAKDVAGNVILTPPDTLVFDEDFENPEPHMFKVERKDDLPDSSIVGVDLSLVITAWDTVLEQAAVTYDEDDVLVSFRVPSSDPEMADALAGSGAFMVSEGKKIKNTMNDDGTVSLDDDGWVLGSRTIGVTTGMAVSMVTVTVEDTSTQTGADQDTAEEMMAKMVDVGGERDSLVWEVGEFDSYSVTIQKNDDDSRSFTITVTPTDSFGNPSTKTSKVDGGDDIDDITEDEGSVFLASRLDPKNILDKVSVELSSPNRGILLPPGRQEVLPGGSTFTGTAPSGDVEIIIRVTSALPSGAASAASMTATGSSDPLDIGEPGPTEPGELAAPANLKVQDYKGPTGEGDQGGYIMVSFPTSEGAMGYDLWREMQVNIELGEDGMVKVNEDSSWAQWVSWTSIGAREAGDDGIVRAVVPVTDGGSTMWAIQAYAGGQSSARVAASKRVFTRESVQLMAQFLGIDPNRVLSYEELSNVFSPPQDYVKSILGDQKNLVFAPMNPDLTVLLATPTVPQSIRTASHGDVMVSARTLTEGPAGAVDNIPPAAVTELEGEMEDGNIALNWLASADDKVVGFIDYRGHATVIPGVESYNVWRSVDDGEMGDGGLGEWSKEPPPSWMIPCQKALRWWFTALSRLIWTTRCRAKCSRCRLRGMSALQTPTVV